MNPELLLFHEQITQCVRPEDLFGPLAGDQLATLKIHFRKFALIAHVDRYTRLDEQRIAHITFVKLNDFNSQAIAKIQAGIYGTDQSPTKKNNTPVSMKSRKYTYIVKKGLAGGDVSAVYTADLLEGDCPVILKVAKHHSFNSFLQNEATILTKLNKTVAGTTSYKQFIPNLIETFEIKVAPDNAVRRVNVLDAVEGFHDLGSVATQYPNGVDQRHFVWIFNRLLTTLSFIHSSGFVHGAVLPNHILIHPISHAIHLIDWCFAIQKDQVITTVPGGFVTWYPPEIREYKRPVSNASDIYMAAKCMCHILGLSHEEGLVKLNIHSKFRRLLQSCLILNQARRPQSAWELYKELGVISEDVFGPKKYVKLVLA